MKVYNFQSFVHVYFDEDLIHHLRSVRKGKYAVFILSHNSSNDDQSSLFIHINEDIAYLHYFPDNRGLHPGFQAKDMMHGDCEEHVHFLMDTGTEADSFIMPRGTLVPVEVAYKAAQEFLREPALPASVSWFEL